MKTVVLFLSFYMTSLASAAPVFVNPGDRTSPLITAKEMPSRIYCLTKAYPTTSIVIEKLDSNISLQVIHHNGTAYAPITKNLTTSYDIFGKHLATKADLVSRMGNSFSTEWSVNQCKWTEHAHIACSNIEHKRLGELDVEGMTFVLYPETSQSPYGINNVYKFELSVGVRTGEYSKQYFDFPMEYKNDPTNSECVAVN